VIGAKQSFANSADSRGDYLDEESERQAFKEAVEEWRRQDADSKASSSVGGGGSKSSSVRIEREYLKGQDGAKDKGKGSTSIVQLSGSNIWKDPFAAPARDVRTRLSAYTASYSPLFPMLACLLYLFTHKGACTRRSCRAKGFPGGGDCMEEWVCGSSLW